MIKKLLLGTLCIAQFSLISAHELNTNPKKDNGTAYFQNVPKTVIIKTKKFKVRIDKQPNGNYVSILGSQHKNYGKTEYDHQ